jgi:spore maturation protein CgeB
MKILIINTDYSEFLEWLYEQHPGLAERSYDEQMRARNESLSGLADFYSSNLKKLGHEARDIYANNHIMQSAWVRRHGQNETMDTLVTTARRFASGTPLRYLKRMLRPLFPSQVLHHVLAAQIRYYKPDILLNQAVTDIPDEFL